MNCLKPDITSGNIPVCQHDFSDIFTNREKMKTKHKLLKAQHTEGNIHVVQHEFGSS